MLCSSLIRRALPILLGLAAGSAACSLDVTVPAAPSPDTASVRLLAERYYAALPKEDVEAVLSLWSAKASALASHRETVQRLFAAYRAVELKSLVIQRVSLDGDRAMARVAVDLTAVDEKSGQPAAGIMTPNRTLRCVREEGAWKIFRELSSEQDLGEALAAAKSPAEQDALLAAEPELLTGTLAEALLLLGDRDFVRGDRGEAGVYFEIARRTAERMGDRARAARALDGIGDVQRAGGGLEAALDSYEKSVSIAGSLADQPALAELHSKLGVTHRALGNYAKSVAAHQKSIELYEAVKDPLHAAQSQSNLGFAHAAHGDYDAALSSYEHSLKQFEALKLTGSAAQVLINISTVEQDRGNYRRALALYDRALAMARAAGESQLTGAALGGIGSVLQYQGSYAQALSYYQQSLSQLEALPGRGRSSGLQTTLSNMGSVYHDMGDHARAREYYQRSLKLSETDPDPAAAAGVLVNIGIVFDDEGRPEQALESYRKGLEKYEAARNRAGVAQTLINISTLYMAQEKQSEALKAAQRAAGLATELESPPLMWRAQLMVGTVSEAIGERQQARAAYTASIGALERLRGGVAGGEQEQQRFFADKVVPYGRMVSLLVEEKQLREAFAYAEQAKGRVLLDVLKNGRADVSKHVTTEERQKEKLLRGEIAALNTALLAERLRPVPDTARITAMAARLEEARSAFESFQTTLYASHAALRTHRGEAPTITPEESASLLPTPATALLEFVVTPERTFLFVLARDPGVPDRQHVTLDVYSIPIESAQLIERIEAFRKLLAEGSIGFDTHARGLWDLLLKPAEGRLRGKNMLCIVPDGPLWELPFQALQPREKHYLVQDAAVLYAPSLTVLRQMRTLRPDRTPEAAKAPPATARAGRAAAAGAPVASPTLLAFGNPALGKAADRRAPAPRVDEHLAPLPHAEAQVKQLARLFGPAQSRIYVGDAAREERAKQEAGRCRILHFATHGILHDRNPMYSHVVLSQAGSGKGEDGLLEAWEMMEMDLKTELVVLSACETARGKVASGEGMIGMSWALFVAGCPRTVVSQWKVDSQSTTALMLAFYSNLRGSRGKAAPSKAEALRQASLKLLRDPRYAHPFYWAPFVVVGDGL